MPLSKKKSMDCFYLRIRILFDKNIFTCIGKLGLEAIAIGGKALRLLRLLNIVLGAPAHHAAPCHFGLRSLYPIAILSIGILAAKNAGH